MTTDTTMPEDDISEQTRTAITCPYLDHWWHDPGPCPYCVAPSPVSRRQWRIGVEWKVQDCWIGVCWRTERMQSRPGVLTTWWVCLVPMISLVIQRVRPRDNGREAL